MGVPLRTKNKNGRAAVADRVETDRAQQCCAPTEAAGKSRLLIWFGMTASGGRQRQLAGGFYWFFFLGLFFFFLFFFLEFVAYEFEDGDFGAITDAVASGNDAGVAAGAIGEFGRDFAEEFFGDRRCHDVGGRLTARLQRVALAEGDHFFGDGTRGFGTGQGGGNAAVLE